MKVWDLDGLDDDSATFTGHTGTVESLAVLDDGRIITVSDDGNTFIWNLDDPSKPLTLSDYNYADSVAVLEDGRIVTSGGGPGMWWDLDNPDNPTSFTHPVGFVGPVAALDDHRIVYLDDDENFSLVVSDLDDEDSLIDLTANESDIYHLGQISLFVVLDGRIIGKYYDDRIAVWNVDEPDKPTGLSFNGDTSITSIAALNDGRVVGATEDGRIHFWDVDDPANPASTASGDGFLTSMTVLPDGRILSTSSAGRFEVWDVDDPGNTTSLAEFSGSVNSVAVLDDNHVVAATGSGFIVVEV